MTYYRKQGRRYVKCDYGDFPVHYLPGIWLVTDGEKSLFMRLGDQPTVMTYAAFARHKNAIASAIAGVQGWASRSPDDMAQAVIDAVAREEESRLVVALAKEKQK